MTHGIPDLRDAVRTIPDFPKPGILFRDISPLLENGDLFRRAVDLLAAECEGIDPVKVVGLDARGFIFGAALAYRLGLGFIPVRKKGKLPFHTLSRSYELEYGMAEFEIHTDSLAVGEPVVIVDDLLATGGTAGAAARLVEELGARVLKALFVIELTGLGGRERVGLAEISSLMCFPA